MARQKTDADKAIELSQEDLNQKCQAHQTWLHPLNVLGLLGKKLDLSEKKINDRLTHYYLGTSLTLEGGDADDYSTASFSGSVFINCTFNKCNLTKTDFSDCDLSRTHFKASQLLQANFSNAVLTNADLTDANLIEASLTKADLTNAILTKAILWRANLTGADLTDAELWGAELWSADLTNAILWRANLTGADLTDAELWGAELWSADLTNAILTGADLTNAELWGANLTDATMINANLTNAGLIDADLTNARLLNADLTGAFLLNTTVTLQRLSTAEFDEILVDAKTLQHLGITEKLNSTFFSLSKDKNNNFTVTPLSRNEAVEKFTANIPQSQKEERTVTLLTYQKEPYELYKNAIFQSEDKNKNTDIQCTIDNFSVTIKPREPKNTGQQIKMPDSYFSFK